MAKQPALVTRHSLQQMIDQCVSTNDSERLQHIVGRALIVLFERQTEHEKRANTTEVWNMVGFNGSDGRQGVLGAKFYMAHHHLEEWQVEQWIRRGRRGFSRITKYSRQLNEAAIQRAARKAGQQELV